MGTGNGPVTDSVQIVSEARIAERVAELGELISRDYAGRELDLVYAVNGASVFAADLARCLNVPARLHPLGFSSYPKAGPSGELRITLDVGEPLAGRHVLLLEGILVSGRTPAYLFEILRLRQPATLAAGALGAKRHLMTANLAVTYVAFEFGDEMVVGYGVGAGGEKTLPYLADGRGA